MKNLDLNFILKSGKAWYCKVTLPTVWSVAKFIQRKYGLKSRQKLNHRSRIVFDVEKENDIICSSSMVESDSHLAGFVV